MLTSQLRDQVLEFVDGNQSPRELEDWIVPRLEHYLQNPHTYDAELVAAIELGLVELGDGITSVDELRAEFNSLIQRQETILVQDHASVTMTTTTSVNRLLPAQPAQQEPANWSLTFQPS